MSFEDTLTKRASRIIFFFLFLNINLQEPGSKKTSHDFRVDSENEPFKILYHL